MAALMAARRSGKVFSYERVAYERTPTTGFYDNLTASGMLVLKVRLRHRRSTEVTLRDRRREVSIGRILYYHDIWELQLKGLASTSRTDTRMLRFGRGGRAWTSDVLARRLRPCRGEQRIFRSAHTLAALILRRSSVGIL
jgi:hypothetical protein